MAAGHNRSDRAAGNLRGIALMLLSTLAISCMLGAVRHVSQTVHPLEIAFFRMLFGLIAVVPWFFTLGLKPLRTRRLGLLGVRGVLNIIAMWAFFICLGLIPLDEATALSFTAPIFATLLAVITFREVVSARRWVAIGVGFLGTLVVLRPGFQEVSTGALLALCAAFIWGACMIIIKSLSRTESSVTITLYMSVVMTPLALVPALFVWSWPTGGELAWLITIGTLGGVGQLAIAQALKEAEAHVVMPVDFVKLAWVSIIGYVAFAESPTVYTWVGGAMIFSVTSFIAYREHALRKAGRAPASLS